MITTAAWLAAHAESELAFSLAFEGYDLVLCTTDAAGIATAYAGTDWTAVKAGLRVPGAMTHRITPFEPGIDAESMTFSAIDYDQTLLATMLREAPSAAHQTYLTASLSAVATTVAVADTTGFAASGAIYCGTERIDYASKTATTFADCTRGICSLYTTSIANRFTRAHLVDGTATIDFGVAPAVLDLPDTWVGRRVALYAHHKENGIWATRANALLLWTGALSEISDGGDGTIAMTAVSIAIELLGDVFACQWSGDLEPGVWIAARHNGVEIRYTLAGAPTTLTGALASSNAQLTWEEALAELQTVFIALSDANITASAQYLDGRISIDVTAALFTAGNACIICLSSRMLYLLGFIGTDTRGLWYRNTAGDEFLRDPPLIFDARGTAAATLRVTAAFAPVRYDHAPLEMDSVKITNERGTWVAQSDGVYGFGATGIVAYGTLLYEAAHSTGVLALKFRARDSDEVAPAPGPIREGAGDPPRLLQIWRREMNSHGAGILELLLSTGILGFNHATYDTLPADMGLGFPASLLDVDSFLSIDDAIGAYAFELTKPESLGDRLEMLCSLTGRYPIWRSGRLTLARPSLEATGQAAAAMTEANKARIDDRAKSRRSTEYLVNRLTVECRGRQYVFADAPSISRYGSHGITIKAPDAYSSRIVDASIQPLLTSLIAYFSRPVTIVERTYNASLATLAPGDAVALTDSYFADARAGTRGVTSQPAWVLSASFDWSSGVGAVTLCYLGGPAPGIWAPAALVSAYVAGTKTLTCSSHAFSATSEAADASRFPAGAQIRIIAIDQAGTPTTATDTVASQSGDDVVLTTGFAAYNGAEIYIVECDDWATCTVTQRATGSFLADDAAASPSDAALYRWGTDGPGASLVVPVIDYTLGMSRFAAIMDDAAEPLSSSIAVHVTDTLNALLAYGTRQHLICEPRFISDRVISSATPTLAYGPIRLPIYGPQRALLCRSCGHVSALGVFMLVTFCSAAQPPSGTAAALLLPPDTQTVAHYHWTTGDAWSAASSLMPAYIPGEPGYTWLWATISVASGTGTLRGLSITEAAL